MYGGHTKGCARPPCSESNRLSDSRLESRKCAQCQKLIAFSSIPKPAVPMSTERQSAHQESKISEIGMARSPQPNIADSLNIYAALFRVRPLPLPRGRWRRFCSASRMRTICSASFFNFRGSSWTSASPHRSLHRRLFRAFITDHPNPLALTVDCRTKA
jgi:hypothetical protein